MFLTAGGGEGTAGVYRDPPKHPVPGCRVPALSAVVGPGCIMSSSL